MNKQTDHQHITSARSNRTAWDKDSDEYQADHRADLIGEKALAWGIWRIPESQLQILGETGNKDVLELGCGAAQWSIALSGRGNGCRPVGLDNSGRQLAHATGYIAEAGAKVPLVHASAEFLPFRADSFDVVFCDYGAMTFVDPYRSIRQVAKVLRPGGLFAFTTTSPFFFVCLDEEKDELTERLLNPYFGLHRAEADGYFDYQVPYGEWVSLFRSNGFKIEDLIEVQPPEDAATSYGGRPLSWSRRWPAEIIWKVTLER